MPPIIRSDVIDYLKTLDTHDRNTLISEAQGEVDPRQMLSDALGAQPIAEPEPSDGSGAVALNSEGIEQALRSALGIGTTVANDQSDFPDFL